LCNQLKGYFEDIKHLTVMTKFLIYDKIPHIWQNSSLLKHDFGSALPWKCPGLGLKPWFSCICGMFHFHCFTSSWCCPSDISSIYEEQTKLIRSSIHFVKYQFYLILFIAGNVLYLLKGRLRGLADSALDQRSLPPEFESRHWHIWMLFLLWLRLITSGGRSAHLAYHVHKSGCESSIINYLLKETENDRCIDK